MGREQQISAPPNEIIAAVVGAHHNHFRDCKTKALAVLRLTASSILVVAVENAAGIHTGKAIGIQ